MGTLAVLLPESQQKLAVAAEQDRAASSRPAVLGRPPSEKKWAYPMPIGSPMFERVRSRNHDQNQDQQAVPASNADTLQPVGPPVQADAAGAPGQEQHTGPAETERSALAFRTAHRSCKLTKTTIEWFDSI